MDSPATPRTFPLGLEGKLPAVGLGTFQGDYGNAQVKEVTLKALKLGYRHIDSAAAYGNEREVGLAIQESGIPRSEIFVTTKLAQTWHKPQDIAKALDESLRELQLEYVDLFLMHFPHAYLSGPNNTTIRHPSGNGKPIIDYELSRAYPDTWRAMEALVGTRKVRFIGISNFNILKTKSLLGSCKIRPVVNQVEVHPYFPQNELVEFCEGEGIHVMAHQPLGGKPVDVVNPNKGHPGPLQDSKIIEIASRLGRSPAQVILSWLVQRGISVVPKSVQEGRLRENLEVFALGDQDFATISSITETMRPVRFLDPSVHLGFDIFDEVEDQPVGNSAPWDQE